MVPKCSTADSTLDDLAHSAWCRGFTAIWFWVVERGDGEAGRWGVRRVERVKGNGGATNG
jgi:hypothetical protein